MHMEGKGVETKNPTEVIFDRAKQLLDARINELKEKTGNEMKPADFEAKALKSVLKKAAEDQGPEIAAAAEALADMFWQHLQDEAKKTEMRAARDAARPETAPRESAKLGSAGQKAYVDMLLEIDALAAKAQQLGIKTMDRGFAGKDARHVTVIAAREETIYTPGHGGISKEELNALTLADLDQLKEEKKAIIQAIGEYERRAKR